MKAINYSSAIESFDKILDQVNDDHTPILITRQKGRSVVLLSLEDFRAYEETFHLMSSPKNAERLNKSIADIEANYTQNLGLTEESL